MTALSKSREPTPSRELVVLTHGIASTRFLLFPLAARLRSAGFATRLTGYPSLWWSNETFGKRLAALLRRLAPGYERVHLVVHSMGGIVARCALREVLPPNFGRVVQIAPPNRGSHVATQLTVECGNPAWDHLVVRPHRFIAPTLRELIDSPDSFVNRLGPVPAGIEVGVITASNDRVVRAGNTLLEGAADHCTVTGWHTGVLWTKETADLTARFLRTGCFGNGGQLSAVSYQPTPMAEA
jgi:pimeloyl-ACP methyl ester carboxylesterase